MLVHAISLRLRQNSSLTVSLTGHPRAAEVAELDAGISVAGSGWAPPSALAFLPHDPVIRRDRIRGGMRPADQRVR